MKQSVQVSILGRQFHLKSDTPPEQVERIVRFAEAQIDEVTASGMAVDSLQAALLALLNLSAKHLAAGVANPDEPTDTDAALKQLIARIEAALDS
ncbi:MAG: cell division protein ZapA [Desulfuromonadales bacterium]|nr:cell division protein ZapA [Desulfuromonadales bacterium]